MSDLLSIIYRGSLSLFIISFVFRHPSRFPANRHFWRKQKFVREFRFTSRKPYVIKNN